MAWLNRENAAKPLSSMSLILLWLSTVKQPSPCVPGAHVEKAVSDPMGPSRGTQQRDATRSHGVAHGLIYPCGKA